MLLLLLGSAYFGSLMFMGGTTDDKTKDLYEEYIYKLEGSMDDEKEGYILSEKEKMDRGKWECEHVSEKSDPDYQAIDYYLQHQMAWEMIYDRYINIMGMDNDGERMMYDDLNLQRFFKQSKVNYYELLAFLIIVLYAVVLDYRNNRHLMIKTSANGGFRYIVTKQNGVMFISVITSLFFSIIQYLYILICGESSKLSYPIRSMCDFSGVKWSVSVCEYLLIRDCIHVMWCVVVALATCCVGIIVRKLQTGLFVALFITILPIQINRMSERKPLMWICSVYLDKEYAVASYSVSAVAWALVCFIVLYLVNGLVWMRYKT